MIHIKGYALFLLSILCLSIEAGESEFGSVHSPSEAVAISDTIDPVSFGIKTKDLFRSLREHNDDAVRAILTDFTPTEFSLFNTLRQEQEKGKVKLATAS